MDIYTIGHSNHNPEKFVKLIEDNLIDLIVDVRSTPYSQWAAFANRENLEKLLSSIDIHYLYLGSLLGGRIEDIHSNKKADRVKAYEYIREQDYFKKGIHILIEECDKHRICILCSEEDPASCHRRLLVGASLIKQGINILHIRGDGRIQLEEDIWKEEHKIDPHQAVFQI